MRFILREKGFEEDYLIRYTKNGASFNIFADPPDDEIDVENYIDMALSAKPSRGSVRDKPVNEDVVIVVY